MNRAILALLLPAALAAGPAVALPDWNGIWTREGSFAFDPSKRPGEFADPPYRPDWMARYREGLERLKRGEPTADPTAACVPGGVPRIMNMVYPMEIRMVPGQVTIIVEWDSQVRRIYTDGRPHPPLEDLDPTFNGHTVGHWEGDTLVFDTVGLREDTVLDQSGLRHSAQMTVSERMREVSPGLLELTLTVNDPIALVRPWTVVKTYRRAPKGAVMMEYVCQENNRNPIDDKGVVRTVLQGGD